RVLAAQLLERSIPALARLMCKTRTEGAFALPRCGLLLECVGHEDLEALVLMEMRGERLAPRGVGLRAQRRARERGEAAAGHGILAEAVFEIGEDAGLVPMHTLAVLGERCEPARRAPLVNVEPRIHEMQARDGHDHRPVGQRALSAARGQ